MERRAEYECICKQEIGVGGALQGASGRKRYLEKLTHLGGFDPYETAKSEWHDNVDLWPSMGWYQSTSERNNIWINLMYGPSLVYMGQFYVPKIPNIYGSILCTLII